MGEYGPPSKIPPLLDKMAVLDKKINKMQDSPPSIEELANYILINHNNDEHIEVINLLSSYIFIVINKMTAYVHLIEILLDNNYFNLLEFYTIGKRKRSMRLVYFLHKNGRTTLKDIIEIAKYNPDLHYYFPNLRGQYPNDDVPAELEFQILNFFPRDSFEYKIMKGEEIEVPKEDVMLSSPFLELPKHLKTIYGIFELYGSNKIKNTFITDDMLIRIDIWLHKEVDKEKLNSDFLHDSIKAINYHSISSIVPHKIDTFFDDNRLPIRDSLSIFLLLRDSKKVKINKRFYAKEGSNTVINYIWNEKTDIFAIDSMFISALQGNNIPLIKKLIVFVDQDSLKVKYAVLSRNLGIVKYFVEERFQTIQFIDINVAAQIASEDILIYFLENYNGYIVENFKKYIVQKILTHHLSELMKCVVKLWKLDRCRMSDIDIELLLDPYIAACDIKALEIVANSGIHPDTNRILIINSAMATNNHRVVELSIHIARWDQKFAPAVATIVGQKFPDLAKKISSFEIEPVCWEPRT